MWKSSDFSDTQILREIDFERWSLVVSETNSLEPPKPSKMAVFELFIWCIQFQ